MKRHKYKFRRELLQQTATKHRRHLVLNFLKAQQFSAPLVSISKRVMLMYYMPHSRTILYCLVTGRIRSTFSITNTSRHIFFWSVDHGFNTGFVMSSW